jgi:hypothetical protein
MDSAGGVGEIGQQREMQMRIAVRQMVDLQRLDQAVHALRRS